MIGLIILFVVGIGAIKLGLKGFAAEGIPLTAKTNITGGPAKTLGSICLTLGFAFLLVAVFLARTALKVK